MLIHHREHLLFLLLKPLHLCAQASEVARRRRAAKISRHVQQFWVKIDKLVVYKHQSKLEAKRREAMDRHLSFLVTQTERYSSTLLLTDAPLLDKVKACAYSRCAVMSCSLCVFVTACAFALMRLVCVCTPVRLLCALM